MADYTVAISGLNALLQSLSANTESTPYKIKVTGLTAYECGNEFYDPEENPYDYGYDSYDEYFGENSFYKILTNNSDKYVDLSETELPSDLVNMNGTFAGCGNLIKSPAVPSSVVNMHCTFIECRALTTLPTIPNGVVNMECTFFICTKIASLSGFVIPSSVRSLRQAFASCDSLTSLSGFTIPNGVTNVESIFSGCYQLSNLSNFTVPSTVTNMNYMFGNCSNLISLSNFTIPNGVTTIKYLFYYCSKLSNSAINGLTIPNSVTDMSGTFYGCKGISNLSSFTIPNSVTNMYSTFAYCEYLTSAPAIPDSVTNMNSTFTGCIRLNTIQTIPGSVRNMDSTFRNCYALGNLSGLVISNGVTNMKDAFMGCYNLSQAPAIPKSVTNTGDIFDGCTNLRKATLQAEDYTNFIVTFGDCTKLTDVYVPSAAAKASLIAKLGDSSYNFPSSLDKNIVIKAVDTAVAFSDLDTYLQGLPANTASVPYRINITGLTASDLASSSTSGTLGYILKQNSTKYIDLIYTELPDNLTSLNNAFKNCTTLVSTPIIYSTTTNLGYAFSGCTNLKQAILNREAFSITKDYIFNGCTSLEKIYVPTASAKTALSSALSSPNDIPSSIDKNETIQVAIKVSISKLNTLLSDLSANTVSTPYSIEIIDTVIDSSLWNSLKSTLSGNLTKYVSLVIPGIINNAEYLFSDCSNLISAEFTGTVDVSLYDACVNLTNLKSIAFKGATTVSSTVEAFYGCSSLQTVDFSGVTSDSFSLGIDTFNGCSSLTKLDLSGLSQLSFSQVENVLGDLGNNIVYLSSDCSIETPFANFLEELLPKLIANTKDAPYSINITGLTSANLESSSTSGTLGYVLNQNSTKYIDLNTTELPSGLTSLNNAFDGCSSLIIAPTILSSITNLNYAFNDCTNFKDIEIQIADYTNVSVSYAFGSCTSLKNIWVPSDTAKSTLSNKLGASDFPSTLDKNETIKVLYTVAFADLNTLLQSLAENTTDTPYYLNITGLTTSNFGYAWNSGSLGYILRQNSTKYVDLSKTVLPSGLTSLQYSFDGCSSLTIAPIIPDGVTSLSSTFYRCTSLTAAPIIPNSVTNIQDTFGYCSSLIKVPNIPDGVTSIGNTFQDCSSLIEVPAIPGGVTTLYCTFRNCTSLKDVEIKSDDFSSIDVSYLFNNCISLKNVCVTSEAARTSLINELKQPDDFPSTLDKNEVIKVFYTVAFTDLNTLLQSLDTNTTSAPYYIKVTDLTAADLGPSSTSGTLGYILRQNLTKYVNLNPTELPVRTDMSTTFSGCSTLVVSPELPNGVTNIGECFNGTSIITPPEIPNTVTNMYATFSSCSRMTSVSNIPDGVISLRGLFRSCTSLTDEALIGLEIPDSVLAIGSSADGPSYFTTYGMFRSDVQLVDMSWLEIPSSVLDAGEAFLGCVSLKYAPTIPDTITSLSKTFYNCTSLETVILEGEDFSDKNLEGIFHDCTSLKNVCVTSEAAKNSLIEELSSFDFPSSLDKKKVIKVGNPCALAELDDYLKSLDANTPSAPYKIIITDLASIDLGSSSSEGTLGYILNQNPTKYVDLSINDLPNDLITLENSFKNCTILIKVPTITEDIENLTNTFYGCSNLKIVTSNIEDYSDVSVDGVFYGCTSLQSIYVASEDAKNSLSDELTDADFPSILDKDEVIKFGLTCQLSELDDFLQSLDINSPESAYQIAVTNLTAADLGSSDNTGTLGYILKQNLTKYIDLTKTVLPNDLISMENSFKNCSNIITPPTIPDSVTDMTGTFRNCTSLTDLYGFEIPDSVTNMSYTFAGCTSLSNVYGFEIPDNVTNLSHTFEDCISLTESPEIPTSVTNMAYTFKGCIDLEEAPTIPENVVILNNTFQNCTSLTTTPTIPDGVIDLTSTFEGCTGLINSTSISSNVVNLNRIFYNCSSLENIILDIENFNHVNLIEAFYGCISVERIIVPSADAKNSLIRNLSSGDYPDIWELNNMIRVQTTEVLEKEVASSVPITEMIIINQDQTVNPKVGSSIVINGNSPVLVTLSDANIDTCKVPVLSNNDDAYVLYYNALGEKVYDRIYSQYSISYIYLGEITVNDNKVSVWMPETGTSYRLNGDQTTQLYDGLPNDYKQYRGNGIYNYYYDTLTGSKTIYDLPDINLCVKISWGNAFTASVVAEQWYQDPAQSLDAGIIWTRSKWESGSHNWFPWIENNGDAAPATLTNKTIDNHDNCLLSTPYWARSTQTINVTGECTIGIDSSSSLSTYIIGNPPATSGYFTVTIVNSVQKDIQFKSYPDGKTTVTKTLSPGTHHLYGVENNGWNYAELSGTYSDNTQFNFLL